MNTYRNCPQCGRPMPSAASRCPACGADVYAPAKEDRVYLGAYRVYKKLPLVTAIIMLSMFAILGIVLGVMFRHIFAFIITVIVGAIVTAVTYAYFVLMLAPTVVGINSMLEIKDYVRAIASRDGKEGPQVPNVQPPAAPSAPTPPRPSAPRPPRYDPTAPQTVYTPIPSARKISVAENRANLKPRTSTNLALGQLEDELRKYYPDFSFYLTASDGSGQSYVYHRSTPTGASFYQVDTDGEKQAKKILIRYKNASLGIVENEDWMRSCLYKDERALSRTEASAVSLYCDLEILHCLIGSHTGSREDIEKAVLSNLCYLGTYDAPDWHVEVSANGSTVNIIAERV